MIKKNWIVDASINGVNKIFTVKNVDNAHLNNIATKIAISLFCCDEEDIKIKGSITI